MKSIRSSLIQAFMIVIAVFVLGSASFIFLHKYVVQQYKAISDNMIAEYQLVDSVSSLIDAYNYRVLSSSTDDTVAQTKLDSTKAQIAKLTSYLDASITNPQSRSDYISLKNTVADVTSVIDKSLSHGGVTDYTAEYREANKKYQFVKDTGTTLLFSQLKYSSLLRDRINQTYLLSQIGMVGLLIVSIIGCLLYALRFSGQLVTPLSMLTFAARRIAGGELNATIDRRLLARRDEIGSLANSFAQMMAELNATITELGQEKAGVEKKVEQRTGELSQQTARLTASVNSLTLGFIMTDSKNAILIINDAARRILSYQITPTGVSKPDPADAKHDWATQEIDERLGEKFHFQHRLAAALVSGLPDGPEEVEYRGRILRIIMTPVLEAGSRKKSLGSVVMLEDITERKVLERSRDEFFSIASHELRTPLTAIRGNTSMIEQFYKDKVNDPDFDEMVSDVHGSSVRLIGIVNDFLDVSRLEQGKISLTMEAFNIDEILESVVYEISAVAKEKKNQIKIVKTLNELPIVYADKNRVKQITYNIVGNAIKATQDGTITINREIDGSSHIKVSVSDTGPGISEQNQKLLFHKFQQAGSSLFTRDTSRGTGLGLYISKLLAEKMGGKIDLERSKIGEGSTFSFTVPVAKPGDKPQKS